MAACEDQPEPVVHDALVVQCGGVLYLGPDPIGERRVRCVPPGIAPHPVDGLEPAGRYEPRARMGGDAVPRPLRKRRREGVVHRFLRELEVAEQADEGGEDPSRLGTVDLSHRLLDIFGGDGHVFRRNVIGHRLGKLRMPIHKILPTDGIPGGLPCIHTTAEHFGIPVSLGDAFCRQTGGARLPGSSAVENDFLLIPQRGQLFTELLYRDGPLQMHGTKRRGVFVGANEERLSIHYFWPSLFRRNTNNLFHG
jgi:hypothetical protein